MDHQNEECPSNIWNSEKKCFFHKHTIKGGWEQADSSHFNEKFSCETVGVMKLVHVSDTEENSYDFTGQRPILTHLVIRLLITFYYSMTAPTTPPMGPQAVTAVGAGVSGFRRSGSSLRGAGRVWV